MSEKTIADLPLTFTTPLPADLLVPAHSPGGGGAGNVLATDLPGSGGGGGGPPLATTPPADPSASAATGVSTSAARGDHVHKVQTAAQTPSTPGGDLAASNVQAALTELDTEKVAVTLVGAAGGLAQLDGSSLVPQAQVPRIAANKVDVTAGGSLPADDLQDTLVAMDTRISALSQSLTLGGTYNAATDTVAAIAGQGFTNGPLPAAAAGNANKYLIINATGTGIGNAAGLGTLESGNWIYSTGSAWVELTINTGTIAAAQVTCTPTGATGATNVDAAIAELTSEKVPTNRAINTTNSLQGGGDLGLARTLSLVGDVATPGANKVYGTDAAGSRGWKNDPAGGGAAVKRSWRINSTSLPTVSPAERGFLAGVAGNGVVYPVYLFSGSADMQADYFGMVDPDYADGAFTVKFNYAPLVAGGLIQWQVAFCRLGPSFVLDAAFTLSYQSVSVTPGTLNAFAEGTISFTKAQADNVVAGSPFMMRFKRVGSDTNTGQAALAIWSTVAKET